MTSEVQIEFMRALTTGQFVLQLLKMDLKAKGNRKQSRACNWKKPLLRLNKILKVSKGCNKSVAPD